MRFSSFAVAPSISADDKEFVALFPDRSSRDELVESVPDRPRVGAIDPRFEFEFQLMCACVLLRDADLALLRRELNLRAEDLARI